MNRTAELSPCGTYRYRLDRIWDEDLPTVCFVMLNPSTADAETDDPTIRKCIGFAKRWGMGGIHVVNLWPFRATDPRELKRAVASDPRAARGSFDRLLDLSDVSWSATHTVAAWGAHANRICAGRVEVVARFLGPELLCLGTTKDGSPRHPLMLAYGTPLERWVPPWGASEEVAP